MNNHIPILVIGAGSIGERHINNLLQLGYNNIYVYRQRNLPFRNVDSEKITVVTDWNLLRDIPFVFSIICTPSNQHLEQAIQCLNMNMHVLVEKPLAHKTFDSGALIQLVQDKNKLLYVAYMMRFHPHIIKVKNHILNNTYGKLKTMRTHWGSYLPDWHPYENYKTSYAAQPEMGGGVALTLSHDLDLVNWLAGAPVQSFTAKFGYSETLGIEAESVADFQITYKNDITAQVHLNYLERQPNRHYIFIFEHATLRLDYFSATLTTSDSAGETQEIIKNFDRNDLFVEELKYFFELIQGENVTSFSKEQILESELITNLCNNE